MKQKHFITLILILLFDQITKLLISMNMNLYDSIKIIPGFFNITYVQNTGAAWSIMEGNMIFFYLITCVALVGMWVYYQHPQTDTLSKWGLVMMMGGTLGNFLDRIRLQYVVDFFDFIIFGYDFPVFNIADIFLCLGVAVLVLSMIVEGVKSNEV